MLALALPAQAQAKQWKSYPYCKTWTCVTHTRELHKKRFVRCRRSSQITTASWYGYEPGYRGDPAGTDTFAELEMGTALGGLPYQARIDAWRTGYKPIRIYKRDIGAGGPGLGGYGRGIDLTPVPARELGVLSAGLALIHWSRNRCF